MTQMQLEPFLNGEKYGKIQAIILKVKETLKGQQWHKYDNVRDTPIEQKIKELGFKFAGSGISRCVYVKDEIALKVETKGQEWGLRYLEQNKEELKNFKNIPEEVMDYFPRIYAHDRGCHWLIVERADTIDNKDSSGKVDDDEDDMTPSRRELVHHFEEVQGELDRIFDEHGIHVNDLHYSNVGEIDGRPVMIDYGYEQYFTPKPKTRKTKSKRKDVHV